jgi:hypothetical protein
MQLPITAVHRLADFHPQAEREADGIQQQKRALFHSTSKPFGDSLSQAFNILASHSTIHQSLYDATSLICCGA